VLILNTATGINTQKEFIDKAKSAPGTMTYASPGVGAPPHLAAELFSLETGVKMKHIPYKGGGAALTDVLGGQVNCLFVGLSVASSNLTSGKIKPLVATGIHRSSELPDVPTFGELGLAKVDFNPWFALIGPAKIDPMIVEKLRQALHATLKSPETIALLKAQGYNPRFDSQEQFASIIQKDTAQWARVVKESGITLE
jgi:tripartite-type tricarboxylate transporter receptor subunit TctC